RVGLNSRSTSTSPSAVDEIFWFRTRDGTAQPKARVRASGLSSSRPSGRSPNPLPKNTEGVTVSNDSASTFLPPVPPTSQPTPTDSTVSCASLLKNWYFSESSRLSKPVTDFPPAGSIAFHVPPSESPRSGVRRLASSPLTSVSLRGSVSPVPGSLLLKTVGSESSSATNGSSTTSVAGKKRLRARRSRTLHSPRGRARGEPSGARTGTRIPGGRAPAPRPPGGGSACGGAQAPP